MVRKAKITKAETAPAQRTLSNATTEAHYKAMFEMFASDGWKQFMKDALTFKTAISNIDAIDENHSVDLRKGQRDILTWLLNQEEIHRVAYEELLDGGGDEDEDALPSELK